MPQSSEGHALLAELYPDGLSFILLPYELEWNQSELRLDLIAESKMGDRLRALGGAPFIEALAESHHLSNSSSASPATRTPPSRPSSYRACGPRSSASPRPSRNYALKVTALVEIEEPATAALAKALLEPIVLEIEHARPRRRGNDAVLNPGAGHALDGVVLPRPPTRAKRGNPDRSGAARRGHRPRRR